MTSATSSLSKERVESVLAGYFGRRFCCLTNRGTTALTAALYALGKPAGAQAVFPAVMCSIPVYSALFAGWRPAFADVNRRDANFDLADLEKVLAGANGRAGAVVPIHMFGQPDDLEALQALCQRHGADLVEDVALSMGAKRRGRRVGGFGRVSCLSFVRKMLPLEMGGAVLTDDPLVDQRARAFVAALPAAPANGRDRVSAAMKAFHALTGFVAAGDWKDLSLLVPFEDQFRRLLLARTEAADWEDSIVLQELEALEEILLSRRKRAEVYETVLQHPRLLPLEHGESCFFAYPVRLVGVSAEAFLHFAAQRGFSFKRVAYPDIQPLFSPRRFLPNAELMEKEVMGFPLDDDQPVSAFWEYAQDFLQVFKEYLDLEKDLPAFRWPGKLELRMG